MKKFLFLPLLAIILASCSTDSDEHVFSENAVVFSTVEPNAYKITTSANPVNCIATLSGNVIIDVSGGFTNPKVVFIADVSNVGLKVQTYNVSLQVEKLYDCEDLNSGVGKIIQFTQNNIQIPALNDPDISLLPSQLPSSCYRWRWVVSGGTSTAPCTTITPWYEEPLF